MTTEQAMMDATQLCLNCRGENPQQAKFCMHCGNALVSSSEGVSGAREQRGLRGEHRVVTVMFVDIVGSTRLARSLGAEAWHSLLGDFFAQAADVVEAAGGTINQYTGDGFMALFGAPKALEDHALQAALAALELRQRMHGLAERVLARYDQSFALRTGLNSGPVVVGAIADDWRRDYTAQGETVHLAARMEQLASPGAILVAERTAALLRDRLPLSPGQSVEPKGAEAPLTVFEVKDGREAAHDAWLSQGQLYLPLIGREDVLGDLQNHLRDLGQDVEHGAVVWVSGEPGVGKTRLGQEIWRQWSELPSRQWLTLRCNPVSQAQARPLAPIRNMLLRWLAVRPDMAAKQARSEIAARIALDYPQLTDLLGLLLEFLGLGEDSSASSGDAERRLAQLPLRLCESLGERRPLLWVDDWQSLDSGSRDFLRFWITELNDNGGGLAVLSSRLSADPDLGAGPRFHRYELAPLHAEQMQELLAALVAPWAAYSDYGRTLLSKAEGNPLFLSEAVAHAVQQGHLQGPAGQRQWCGGVQDWELPDSVQALLASRMETAGTWAADILSTAALIGRDFSQAWLAIAAEQPSPNSTSLCKAWRRRA